MGHGSSSWSVATPCHAPLPLPLGVLLPAPPLLRVGARGRPPRRLLSRGSSPPPSPPRRQAALLRKCADWRRERWQLTGARTLPARGRRVRQVETAVGRCAKGEQGMRHPPVLPGGGLGLRYDTLVNDVRNPSIFVVPRSNQAYPAYELTYGPPRPRRLPSLASVV